jgi:hypothetical protein
MGGVMPGVVAASKCIKTEEVLAASVVCAPTPVAMMASIGLQMPFVFAGDWYSFQFGCGVSSTTTPGLWFEITYV